MTLVRYLVPNINHAGSPHLALFAVILRLLFFLFPSLYSTSFISSDVVQNAKLLVLNQNDVSVKIAILSLKLVGKF